MTRGDLRAVEAVGDLVHPNYPEAPAVLDEKRRLYPEGSFVLERDRSVQGYVVAHPWRLGQPPKLNTPLQCIPADADTLYVHDLAVLPLLRGTGAGSAIVAHLANRAGRMPLSLVAVSHSIPFWTKHGFAIAPATLTTYGPEARFMVRLP